MIYLASPYSHPDERVREMRFELACRAATELIRTGEIVYAPVIHCHPFVEYGLPTDWSYWERADRAFIEVCDEVDVLTLEGWHESQGLQREIQLAGELGKAVRYLAPDGTVLPTVAHVAKEGLV